MVGERAHGSQRPTPWRLASSRRARGSGVAGASLGPAQSIPCGPSSASQRLLYSSNEENYWRDAPGATRRMDEARCSIRSLLCSLCKPSGVKAIKSFVVCLIEPTFFNAPKPLQPLVHDRKIRLRLFWDREPFCAWAPR